MNNTSSWLARGAVATTLLTTAILGAGISHAEVTVTPTRLSGARYQLEAVATGAPCDAWEWTLVAGPGGSVSFSDVDGATAEVLLDPGLYVFRATCIREGGENESTVVTIDTRPSVPGELPSVEMWAIPFDWPLCLTCPIWPDALEKSILDIRQEGAIRTDIDFWTFADYAAEFGVKPATLPKLPENLQLAYGGIDTFTSSVQGEDLGTGLTLTGYTYDGSERITVGAFNVGESGMVVGAFLLEAMGDPTPQAN